MTKTLDKYVICPVCGVTLVKRVYSSWFDMPICGDCRSYHAGLSKLERRALKDVYYGNEETTYKVERTVKDLSLVCKNKAVPKTKEFLKEIEGMLDECDTINVGVHRTYFILCYGNKEYKKGSIGLNLEVSLTYEPVYKYKYVLWTSVDFN